MKPQVIVPFRPGPLIDVPEEDGSSPGEPTALVGAPEIALAAGGALLLAAVLIAGLPGWLSVVAVACLALGLALPVDAGHLAVAEVAGRLDGQAPEEADLDYVAARADAVSALADRLADGPVMPIELAGTDSLARIKALLA
jgi:hypothetical protein